MPTSASIYIGTSGWSYPKGEGTWQGYFYPAGKINELEYYSQFFNTVEINSSFYRPPDPGFVYNWARRVPQGFLFAVKLWQKFTHPKMYKEATGEEAVVAQDDVDRFKKSLEPLVKYGKLGALLAQFPPSFKNDEHGQQILGAVAKAFGEYKLAVELRHRSWSDDEDTARFLRERNMAWVQIDDSETRYRYLYSPEEIAGLADRVRAAGEKTRLLFAFFNNHWQAYAPRNANDLKRALQLPFQEITMNLEIAQDELNTRKKDGAR
jgi:uncharacterized protein YecE (DUF72 family)